MTLLLAYYWRGNVRELAHTVERAGLPARGPEAGPEDLLPEIERGNHPADLEFRVSRLRQSDRPAAILHAAAEAQGPEYFHLIGTISGPQSVKAG